MGCLLAHLHMNAISLLLKTTGMCASYTLNELSSIRLFDEVYNAGDFFLLQLWGLMELLNGLSP